MNLEGKHDGKVYSDLKFAFSLVLKFEHPIFRYETEFELDRRVQFANAYRCCCRFVVTTYTVCNHIKLAFYSVAKTSNMVESL